MKTLLLIQQGFFLEGDDESKPYVKHRENKHQQLHIQSPVAGNGQLKGIEK
ncbi:MAG: hypothetical protein QNJ54_34040 [Prochloraceae cyanobacterium]|nr:hypothetical protein [Prochloraceae cyanobacterium]